MAILEKISNTLNCGASNAKGTGLRHCAFDLSDMSGSGAIGLLDKGKFLPLDITRETLSKSISKGDLTWLKGIFAMTLESGEAQIETSSGGVDRLGTEGLPKMTITFANGKYFNAALHTLQSYGTKELILSDGSNLEYRLSTIGEPRGYTVGQITHNSYVRAEGGTSAKSSITIQLINKRQYAQDFAYVSGENLGFDLTDIDAVNDITYSFVNVPQASDLGLRIKVLNAPDSHAIEELVLANHRIKRNGVLEVFTEGAVKGTDGIYDLTLASAVVTGDTFTAETYDASNLSRGIITSNDVIYKSNTATVVAIA